MNSDSNLKKVKKLRKHTTQNSRKNLEFKRNLSKLKQKTHGLHIVEMIPLTENRVALLNTRRPSITNGKYDEIYPSQNDTYVHLVVAIKYA